MGQDGGLSPTAGPDNNADPFGIGAMLKEPLRPVHREIRRALDPLHDAERNLKRAEAKRARRRERNKERARG